MAGREIVPLIPIPDPDDLGERMCACTVGERAWVIAKLETGGDNSECARLAGYSTSSPDVLKSTGYAIAHRQRVQDALLEQSRKMLKTELPRSLRTMIELRDDKKIKAEIRLKAAIEIMNRAGMGAIQKSQLTVTHELSEAELVQSIRVLSANLGFSEDIVRRMLLSAGTLKGNGEAIDAEFTVVSPPISDRARRAGSQERDATAAPANVAKATQGRKHRIRAERTAAMKAKYAQAQTTGREGLEDLF